MESVSRRVNGARVVLLSWPRAILLQFAHPLIAAGVDDHSSFRASPFASITRLHHTVRAMRTLTFGDAAAQQRTIATIRGIHGRVHGVLREPAGRFAAGTPYSADDPGLLLWVHATLLDSILLLYASVVAPLSPAERDAYCDEAAPTAIALGARPDEVPHTWPALRAYFDAMLASDALVVSGQARALAQALLYPPPARLIWPAGWLNRAITIGLLPPRVRAAYGWPAADRACEAALHIVWLAHRAIPDRLGRWPEARPAGHRTGPT